MDQQFSEQSAARYRSILLEMRRAWGDFEGETWAGGFVLELRDGRRVYAESYADGPDWGPDSCVSVVAVPTDSLLPKLPKDHDSQLYGWVEESPGAERLLETAGLAPPKSAKIPV